MALNSREHIIQQIRKAIIHPSDPPKRGRVESLPTDSPFVECGEDLAIEFAQRLLALQGKFVYAESIAELSSCLRQAAGEVNPGQIQCMEPPIREILRLCNFPFAQSIHDPESGTTDEELRSMEIGVTSCEALIAWSGSVLVSSRQNLGRTMTILPPVHWVIASPSQLVPRWKDGWQRVRERYADSGLPSMVSTISGPSRTADIEKTLVLGAHGPKDFWVFLLEDGCTG
jgi:L-lactate dehydrogenase complex protein LldG